MEKAEKAQPKFSTDFTEKKPPSDHRIPELKRWCRIFHETELAPSYGEGTFGNLSYRIKAGEDRFIITASAVGLKDSLSVNEFVEVLDIDMTSMKVKAIGVRHPSSESMLHMAIYRKRPEIMAVFHGHCAAILQKAKMLSIPETSKEQDYGSTALVNGVIEIIGNSNFVIMKDHGFISLGRTIEEAGNNALNTLRACRT